MNNFKRHPEQKKPKTGSIDGFVTRSGPQTEKTDLHKKFRTNYQPEQQDSIDNMKFRDEGFTSNQQAASFLDKQPTSNQLGAFESSFSPLILQEEVEKPRRRLFRRNKTKHKKPIGKVKKAVRVFAVLSIALVLGVASLFGYGYIKTRQIFKGDGEGAAALQKNVDPARLNGEGDGRVNILLIGKGGPGHEAPDLTDTLLLASIDPIQNEAALVSVPRDLYVKDSRGYSSKINAIYSNAKQLRLAKGNESDADTEAGEIAGLTAIKDSISSVLGIPVHYYIMVDFTFEWDALTQQVGDCSDSERMRGQPKRQTAGLHSAFDHAAHVTGGHGAIAQSHCFAIGRAEEGTIGRVTQSRSCRLQIRSQQSLQIMPHRDLPGLAALVEKVQAVLITAVVQILEFQLSYRTNSGRSVNQNRHDRLVAKSDDVVCVDGRQQFPSLLDCDLGRLAFQHLIAFASNRQCGIQGNGMAGHHAVEEMPETSEDLLLAGDRMRQFIKVDSDFCRRYLVQASLPQFAPLKKT